MSCEAWQEKIIDRIADELHDSEAIRLEQHLAECPACTSELERLQQLLEAAVPREEWAGDSGLEERLVAEMRTLHRRPDSAERWRTFWQRPLPAYSLVVMALIALVGGFWMGQTPRSDPQSAAPSAGSAPTIIPPAISPTGQAIAEESVALATALPERSAAARSTRARFVAVPSDAFGWERSSAPDSL